MGAWFAGLSLLARLGIIAGLALTAVVAYKGWELKVWNDGREYERNLIAAQDKGAVDAANDAFARVADCRAVNGVWRPATGKCEKR